MNEKTNVILSIIAISLIVIAIQIHNLAPPTLGDLKAINDIVNDEAKKEAKIALMSKLPLVRVQGGAIDANAYIQ